MNPLVVLHVDDEPDIREVAALSLQLDPSITLISVPSGEEALSRLYAGLTPDVILLDVMMPMLDGPATLSRLREIPGQEDTPVLFMTARAQAQEQNRYLALGARAVILKPFDPMTLARDVRDALAQNA
ncbi:response regulator [Brevundimonas sp. NPDC092305]|uniref:response regulator n=1 Tax=Brevundimonas sp. NPDC092305 TaxID=3363957 RepID=UPI0037FEBAD7